MLSLTTRSLVRIRPRCPPRSSRAIFSIFRKSKDKTSDPVPILSQDNLFHPFSASPFPPVRARGQAIQQLASCPVCVAFHTPQPRTVKFECPDCGWPTHCSEEHHRVDEEHAKYCTRLREANEEEHDLRSGRRIREFELPGASATLPYPEPPLNQS
jgi:splicing suppressor protein 51